MLSYLEIHQFRNMAFAKLDVEQINLFCGKNGSGKTSILEAIYYLGTGRSFRSRHLERIIQNDAHFFSLFSKISGVPIGLKRNLEGVFQIRINEKEVHSAAELAGFFPLQLLNHNSFDLLIAGPKERRKFLDWGVFHVEQQRFLMSWKNLVRIIKQRNAALKTKSINQVKAWNMDLIKISQEINLVRENYLKEWLIVLNGLLEQVGFDFKIDINFYSGWNSDLSLEEVINQSIEKDIAFGFTQNGAHKADIKITIDKKPIYDVLSRGQQKLFISVMKIAQAKLLKEKKKINCAFLIDDLISELDEHNRALICKLLTNLNFQLFITAIDRNPLEKLFHAQPYKLFHVEHGKIFRLEN